MRTEKPVITMGWELGKDLVDCPYKKGKTGILCAEFRYVVRRDGEEVRLASAPMLPDYAAFTEAELQDGSVGSRTSSLYIGQRHRLAALQIFADHRNAQSEKSNVIPLVQPHVEELPVLNFRHG